MTRREIEQEVNQLILQRLHTPPGDGELPPIIAFPIGDDNSALRNRFKRKQHKFEDKMLSLIIYFFDFLVSVSELFAHLLRFIILSLRRIIVMSSLAKLSWPNLNRNYFPHILI